MKDGFINFLKPPGMTSHDAVGYVRRIMNVKRVGHAGTLDPGAAGVLPVAVGRAARLIEYLDEVSKSYRAELLFGIETDSGDDLGEVVECSDAPMPDDEAIQKAVLSQTGTIDQIPPVYSAVKINGRRACDLARRHLSVEIPSRQVTIYRLDVLAKRDRGLLLDIDCSKGTYIRSICRDIGRAAGIPAAMAFLLRTRVGAFQLKDAVTPEELEKLGEAAVMAPEAYLQHLERYDVPVHRIAAMQNGLPNHDKSVKFSDMQRLRLYGENNFLGIGKYHAEDESVYPDKIYRA